MPVGEGEPVQRVDALKPPFLQGKTVLLVSQGIRSREIGRTKGDGTMTQECYPLRMTQECYPLGQHPEVGTVPKLMLAHCIRRSRFGEPITAMQIEKVPVPSELKPHEVLVYVMAAGANYNVTWASRGIPIDVIAFCNKNGQPEEHFVPGSDAAGIVWKVGSAVTNVKVGDEVIIHGCRYDYEDPDIKAGKDPGFASSLHMYGYESNFGSLAQYTQVQDHQCVPKPRNLTWVESASFMVSGAAAYRMLHGWVGNTVQKDDAVLIWGGSGGLGSMAIQIAKVAGAKPVAVVSSPKKFEYCMNLGAVGVINRLEFDHWGPLPHWKDQEKYQVWLQGVRKFGKAFWKALGEKRNPMIVFEHPGEDTIPTSIFLAERGGMVVICAGTSGFLGSFDLRYHWIRQKRLQGSHFANDEQCAAITKLVGDGKVDPCLSLIFPFEEAAKCHQLISDNRHPPGNMAVLVNAVSKEQKTLEK